MSWPEVGFSVTNWAVDGVSCAEVALIQDVSATPPKRGQKNAEEKQLDKFFQTTPDIFFPLHLLWIKTVEQVAAFISSKPQTWPSRKATKTSDLKSYSCALHAVFVLQVVGTFTRKSFICSCSLCFLPPGYCRVRGEVGNTHDFHVEERDGSSARIFFYFFFNSLLFLKD